MKSIKTAIFSFFTAAVVLAGGGGVFILPEMFTRKPADGKSAKAEDNSFPLAAL